MARKRSKSSRSWTRRSSRSRRRAPKRQRKPRGRVRKRAKTIKYNTKSVARDKLYKALPPGWRISRSGKPYYENRSNRSDWNPKEGL